MVLFYCINSLDYFTNCLLQDLIIIEKKSMLYYMYKIDV